jgi:redox-sensitive bicupin YhaK (pirin superfamily)
MSIKRKLNKVYTPPAQPGFLGKGHVARPVIQIDFDESDPFIMLMDDLLDKKDDIPVGGPHPHAGFETVSLLLEGEIGEEPHVMKAGDFEMMTAGSGIVHTETISKQTKMRLLQLWLNLPKSERHTLPRIQKLKSEHVPQLSKDGVSIKVYSGSLASLLSPVRNHTPITIAEINMKSKASAVEVIPANFNAFLYVIDGSVRVGEEEKILAKDEVGWLDLHVEAASSELILRAGDEGVRFVLYAAAPQNHEIVAHGPFIADTMEDIRQLYSDFRQGKMEHISEVSEEQKLVY